MCNLIILPETDTDRQNDHLGWFHAEDARTFITSNLHMFLHTEHHLINIMSACFACVVVAHTQEGLKQIETVPDYTVYKLK